VGIRPPLAITAEVASRSEASIRERHALARRHERAERERFHLMEAYYANAIDVAIVRAERTASMLSYGLSRPGKQHSMTLSNIGRGHGQRAPVRNAVHPRLPARR
jgi:hypothetical protein